MAAAACRAMRRAVVQPTAARGAARAHGGGSVPGKAAASALKYGVRGPDGAARVGGSAGAALFIERTAAAPRRLLAFAQPRSFRPPPLAPSFSPPRRPPLSRTEPPPPPPPQNLRMPAPPPAG